MYLYILKLDIQLDLIKDSQAIIDLINTYNNKFSLEMGMLPQHENDYLPNNDIDTKGVNLYNKDFSNTIYKNIEKQFK